MNEPRSKPGVKRTEQDTQRTMEPFLIFQLFARNLV